MSGLLYCRKTESEVSGTTEKQKRFCEEYLIDLNATQAAIRSGYSQKSAYTVGQKLTKKDEVKSYIAEMTERLRAENVAEAQEVMRYLTDVMRGKSRSSVLCLAGEGAQTVIEKPPDERERLKAAELLGKRYGLFTDKLQMDGNVPIVISGAESLED